MDTEQKEAVEKLITELKLEGCSNYTIRNYVHAVESLLTYTNKKIVQITENDVRFYLASLFDKRSTATISLTASALRYFLSEVLDRPVGKIKIPKREKTLPEVLTKEEVDQIIKIAPSPKSKLIIRLMYTTGLRVSEAVSLRRQDIDFQTGRAKLKGKGKKTRQILLPQTILAELKSFSKDNPEFLFSNNKPLTTRSVQKILNEISKKLNISKKITPHMLRHSYATHLLEDGVDIRVIQSLLGHKNLATTQIYTEVTESLLKKAEENIKKLDRTIK